MAIKSGSGRASLILANETRSGLRDREDNGQLLPGEKRRVRAVLLIRGGRGRTTVRAARARADPAELRNQEHADARQPGILSWDVPGYNPSAARAWRAERPGVRDRLRKPSPTVKDPGGRTGQAGAHPVRTGITGPRRWRRPPRGRPWPSRRRP